MDNLVKALDNILWVIDAALIAMEAFGYKTLMGVNIKRLSLLISVVGCLVLIVYAVCTGSSYVEAGKKALTLVLHLILWSRDMID